VRKLIEKNIDSLELICCFNTTMVGGKKLGFSKNEKNPQFQNSNDLLLNIKIGRK
jgi:hypothetical protein